jgi:hypothetical protein
MSTDDQPPADPQKAPPLPADGIPMMVLDMMISTFVTKALRRLPRAAKLKLASELHKVLWPNAHAAKPEGPDDETKP